MNTQLYRGMVTPRDWVAVGAILSMLLVVAAIYFFVIRASQQKDLEEIDKEVAETRKAIAEALLKKENISKLQDEMDKTQLLVNEFEKRLPSTSEILSLVTEIEAMANQVNLRLNVAPLPPQSDERKQTLPYRVTAYGNFHQITGFINLIERFKRFLKVSDLVIEEQKLGESKATFTLSTYRFLQPQEEPNAEAPQAEQGGKP